MSVACLFITVTIYVLTLMVPSIALASLDTFYNQMDTPVKVKYQFPEK